MSPTEMKKAGAALKSEKTKTKTAKSKPKSKPSGPTRAGSKTEIVANLLKRAGGCTTKDILNATGWPSVSVPAMAKAAGLKLRKEKKDGPARYYGS